MSTGVADSRVELSEQTFPYRHWWGLLGCAALMGLIVVMGPYSEGVTFAPEQGNFWYRWQLADANVWTRLAAWVPYSLHQVAIWFLIAYAQRAKPKYIFGLHSFNLWALAVNGFFIVIHIFQTKLSYDGLAQDVHEATSMGSVALMLFLILLMENRRRGLFMGKPVKSLYTVGDTVKRYHGYYFSWAIIYTFWYHPVELTSGHLAGYAYIMLLILQSSLFFTKFHTNRWWTMFLEVLFVAHGALVAYTIMKDNAGGPWSMFLFGGIMTFLAVQLHGLGLSWKGKLAIATPLVALMIVYYANAPESIFGAPRLTILMYVGTFLMAAIVWVLTRLGGLFAGSELQHHTGRCSSKNIAVRREPVLTPVIRLNRFR